MNDTRSILIVDDNQQQRDATEALFVVEEYIVRTAATPDDAMEILRSDMDLSLALFDIKLGTEAKGLKLIMDARLQRPPLRIIVYTGVDPQLGSKALKAGATFFIPKSAPEDLAKIAGSVAEMWELEKKLETHRLKSEEMKRIFDAVGIEILVRDSKERIILVNQTKRKAWQKRHPNSKRLECLGEILCPDDEELADGVKPSPVSGSKRYPKTRELKTAGYTLLIETRPLHSDDGSEIGRIEAAIDISRRQEILEFEHQIETMFASATKEEIAQQIVNRLGLFTGGRVRLYLRTGNAFVGYCCARMDPGIQFIGYQLDPDDAQTKIAFQELYPSMLLLDGTIADPGRDYLDTHGATEKLFIPLMQSHEPLGLIVIDNKPCPLREFTREDIELLALFRPCVESALTSTDHRDRERQGERWLQAISEIDQMLLSANHFDEVQENVMTKVYEILKADSTVFLVGEDPQHLCPVVHMPKGILESGRKEIATTPGGPLEWVFTRKTSLKVESDLWNDERFAVLEASESAYLPPGAGRCQAALLCPLDILGNIWAVALFGFFRPISLSEIEQSYLNIMLQRISMAKARRNDYSEMERTAMERAKESTVGLLAAAFSHTIRTSIAGLLHKTTLLERMVDEEHRADVSELVNDIKCISNRSESLRTWIMPDRGHAPEIDLVATLREMDDLLTDIARPKGVHIHINLPDDPVWVDSGGGTLKIAVLDIFQNAVKFLNEGNAVRATLVREDNTAALAIHDEGPGLPPLVLTAINEPKASPAGNRRPTPFGIGLYLALKAVAGVGGTIRASNPEAGGAKFEIRIPISTLEVKP